MINFAQKLNQFPHYHRKFTAYILTQPLNIMLLLIITLLIILNLFHTVFFGFNEEKRLKKNIVLFPFVSGFHEELGAFYLGFNLLEAGNEYLLANNLYKDEGTPEDAIAQVLGIASSPFQTWLKLISYNQTVTEDLNNWQKIEAVFPNYSYSHLKKAFLFDLLANADGVKKELQNLGWDYKDLPEVINLKNKYGFR